MWWLLPALVFGDQVVVTFKDSPEGPVPVRSTLTTGTCIETSRPGSLHLEDPQGRIISSVDPSPPVSHRSLAPGRGFEGVATLVRPAAWTVCLPWTGEDDAFPIFGGKRLPLQRQTATDADPVQRSGPSDQRLDLVILSEGYTDADEDLFADDLQRFIEGLSEVEPLSTYGDLLNIWSVFVPSEERGIDKPNEDLERDTPFGCGYSCNGTLSPQLNRLICCDELAIAEAIDDTAPFADGVLVLVIDREEDDYGGSGGPDYAVSYTGPQFARAALHETAHGLFGLADEYTYGYFDTVEFCPDSPNEVCPAVLDARDEGLVNCTHDHVHSPLSPTGESYAAHPEPEVLPWSELQSLEGDPEGYLSCTYDNWWRPTGSFCLMHTLTRDTFCPVCTEHLISSLYSPLDNQLVSDVSPPPQAQDRWVLEAEDTLTFSATPLFSSPQLTPIWSVDGTVVEEGDWELTIDGCLGVDEELTLTVVDTYPWVTEATRATSMTQVFTWPLTTERCGCSCGQPVSPRGFWPFLVFLPILLRRRNHA